MVGKFEDIPFHRARYRDIVDQASGGQPTLLRTGYGREMGDQPQMNNVFAQAHAPGVRADGDAELGGHQQDRENLTHTSEADGIDLADVDGFGLEKLLEDHPVVRVLASCDADTVWLESLSDSSVAEDIVGSSGLFDEPIG
jgi:hypothetical protein